MRRQSEHFAEYRTALEKLTALGLVYPAFESRAEIAGLIRLKETEAPWPRDPDGAPLYPGTARALPPEERARLMQAGAPYALRLDMAAACARVGRIELVRTRRGPARRNRDGRRPIPPPGATSSSRARRRRPAITSPWWSTTHCKVSREVVRGQDLFWSTSVHRLLQQLLGLAASQPIGITVSFATLPGKSCRNRRRRPACAN